MQFGTFASNNAAWRHSVCGKRCAPNYRQTQLRSGLTPRTGVTLTAARMASAAQAPVPARSHRSTVCWPSCITKWIGTRATAAASSGHCEAPQLRRDRCNGPGFHVAQQRCSRMGAAGARGVTVDGNGGTLTGGVSIFFGGVIELQNVGYVVNLYYWPCRDSGRRLLFAVRSHFWHLLRRGPNAS